MATALDVVGIGSCTVDYFAIVPRLLHSEEKVNVTRTEIHAGGVTANNLTQLARLGASAGWLGLLGDDDGGRIITEAFLGDGMDVSGIEIVTGGRSSQTWIPVDAQGERCIYMFPNVSGEITAAQVRNRFAGHIRNAKHFHTEASQFPIAPSTEAMKIAREAGTRTFFDLDVPSSFFVESKLGTHEELLDAINYADVLKPCKAAAHELTGETDPEKIAKQLLTLGPSVVAVTLGADGCLITSKDRTASVRSFPVHVVDTTGAGDAFMGGLSYALLQDWDFERVGLFANACAALCCTAVGARAMSKRADVVEFIKKNVRTDDV